ncbi:MAG: L-threonylcarbamoyladenylate synthase [Candidatus Calescibacterium sp.]|nr:L-threonylcarbamoyladenylate synthase [Candidatus Calescibacterium sp.]
MQFKKGIDEKIKKAAEIIKSGGVVAFPTETVYGLGANAYDEQAVKKIFELKGRPQDNPLIVHISKKQDVYIVAREIPEKAKVLIGEFWPGPLTLVLPKNPSIPDIVTAGLDTVAVRMPDHPIALKLIRLSGVPIAAPSANISGKPSATQPEHIKKYFGEKVFLIEGKVKIGIESTVLDLTEDVPKILRPGAITKEMIERKIGKVELVEYKKADFIPKSPGLKYRHYTPDAELILILRKDKMINFIKENRRNWEEKGKKVCVFFFREKPKKFESSPNIKVSISGRSLREFAKNLFKILIEEGEKYDILIFEGVDERGIGLGIMNRLKKAARRIIR